MPAPTPRSIRADSAQRQRRLPLVLVLSFGTVLSATRSSNADAPDTAAADFAPTLADRLVPVVAKAAALDPDTLEEQQAARKERRRRQRELLRWFEAKERQVGPHNCTTPEDQRNLAEFRTTMAGHELLAQPRRRRQQLVRELRMVMDEWAAAFQPALLATIEDIADNAVRCTVHEAIAPAFGQPLEVRALYFGRRTSASIGSFYAPQAHTLVLNLDVVTERMDEFLDSVEHEVWHHLLPIVTPSDVARNIWWEGFTEALSEICGAHLHRSTPGLERLYCPAVQYPVQAAFASLFLAVDRGATLHWLAGNTSPADFTAALLAGAGAEGQPTNRLRLALAEIVQDGYRLDPVRRANLETLLGHWHWREPNGEPVCLGPLLHADSLDHAALNRTFGENPEVFTAIVDAYTTVLLQELRNGKNVAPDVALSHLPENLQRNARRVLRWAADPLVPLPSQIEP